MRTEGADTCSTGCRSGWGRRLTLASLIAALGLLLTGCHPFRTGVEDPPPPPSCRGIVDDLVRPLHEEEPPLIGFVVGVLHQDRQEVFGYGETGLGPGDRPDGDTVFEIASVTKPLTALLLARRVTEGTLDLDRPLVPCESSPPSSLCYEVEAVTLLHLATHTSGLPVIPANLGEDRDDYTVEAFRRFLATYRLSRAPGSRFEYSTVGYVLLGMHLATTGGSTSFETALRREVLAPLGMTSTRFDIPEALATRCVPGHAQGAVVSQSLCPDVFRPSGGLRSTVKDLLKLVAANLRPETHPDLAEAIALTQRAFPEIPSFPPSIAAVGWHRFVPTGAYWHSGVGAGFRAFVAFDRPGISGIVILTNTGLPVTDARIEMAGFSLLAALAAGPRAPTAASRETSDLPAAGDEAGRQSDAL